MWILVWAAIVVNNLIQRIIVNVFSSSPPCTTLYAWYRIAGFSYSFESVIDFWDGMRIAVWNTKIMSAWCKSGYVGTMDTRYTDCPTTDNNK